MLLNGWMVEWFHATQNDTQTLTSTGCEGILFHDDRLIVVYDKDPCVSVFYVLCKLAQGVTYFRNE